MGLSNLFDDAAHAFKKRIIFRRVLTNIETREFGLRSPSIKLCFINSVPPSGLVFEETTYFHQDQVGLGLLQL